MILLNQTWKHVAASENATYPNKNDINNNSTMDLVVVSGNILQYFINWLPFSSIRLEDVRPP